MNDVTTYPRVDWRTAVKDSARFHYNTKNGKSFNAWVCSKGTSRHLGVFTTTEEAENAVYEFMARRLKVSVREYGLNIDDGVVYMNDYIIFRNGMIFTMSGRRLDGCICDKTGYNRVTLCGVAARRDKVIASIFCNKGPGAKYVKHIDGDKNNNSADNLEWTAEYIFRKKERKNDQT